MQRFKTQVLLLHSEQSTLDRFSASLGDAYSVHVATSGTEALNTLGLTPIHVMVSAQRLPGMSGIEALREARKRSPETLGILIAPKDMSGAEAEALVGSEELFQVIRGLGTPEEMRRVIDDAVDQLRLNTLQESANDRSAGPRPRVSPTAPRREAGPLRPSAAGAEASGTYPAAAGTAAATELVVLSKDEVFLDTIRQALSPRQSVHAVDDLRAAAKLVSDATSAVLVTDAAVAPRDVEAITARLRNHQPGLVTIVAGRRDDGDQLMDLINAGMVYRFLLKPISPGRARLAIEAAIRRAQEKAKPAVSAAPAPAAVAPPTPAARVEPTIADFEGAEEVVLSEEEPAPRSPARAETARPAAVKPKGRRKESKAKKKDGRPQEKAPPEKAGGGGRLSRAARLAGAGALIALVAAGGSWWVTGGPDGGAARSPAGTSAGASPPEAAADPAGEVRSEPPTPPVNRDLQRAREAVAEGRLLAPGENGALALYAAALAQAPDDQALAAEVEQVVAEAIATVVAALDAGRPGEARAARSVIRASFPAATGLEDLDTRITAAERDRLLARADELAAAGDTEGAMGVLDEAAALVPGRSPAVEARRESILAASDGRGRTLLLELGNQRLLQGQLVQPAADNARYYYRAVLAQDSESIAGRQGMAFLRTALITRIRESVEAGDRAAAEHWLEEARLSGVEEARLAPFREAAGRLPAPPAARTPAPAAEESAEPAEITAAPEQAGTAPGEHTAEQNGPAEELGDPPDEVTDAVVDTPAENQSDPATDRRSDDSDTNPADAPAAEPADDPAAERTAAGSPDPARPERITYVPPEYPRAAEMRGLEGWVDVEFSLTPAGRPADILVTDARPAGTFDQAAVEAVGQWRYEPLAAADRPAGERVRVRINFGIDR
ncbi:TonB family protein [Lentisalinibacter salinarum]|uniref:TonB family protein n=1 Tax=Lentisalinibacter salinarum TaxID=2992239 RepID=UPI00386DBA3E